jgi:Ca2+-binding EF-hand superfamily protein
MSLSPQLTKCLTQLEAKFRSLDVDRCGQLTLAQFSRIVSLNGTFRDQDKLTKVPPPAPPPQPPKLFATVDSDGSNRLSYSEFQVLMFLWPKIGDYSLVFRGAAATEVASAFSLLEKAFVAYDADHSLSLSRGEALRFFAENLPGCAGVDAAISAVMAGGAPSLSFGRFMMALYIVLIPDGAYVPGRSESPQGDLPALLMRAFTSLETDFRNLDADDSGAVELRELTNGISNFLPSYSRVDILSRLETTFADVDLDGSGAIDFYEYLFFVYLLTQDGSYKEVLDAATDAATVKKAFMVLRSSYSKYDADHSKRLSVDEMGRFVADNIPSIAALWRPVFASLQSSPDRPHIDFVRFMRLLYEILLPVTPPPPPARADAFQAGRYVGRNANKAKPAAPVFDAGESGPKQLPRFDDVVQSEVHTDKQLGKGGGGTVYKATYRGVTCAAKFLLSDATQEECRATEEECALMRKLVHPNGRGEGGVLR